MGVSYAIAMRCITRSGVFTSSITQVDLRDSLEINPEYLPAVENPERAVVLLPLRGSGEIGSTFMYVIKHYAASLNSRQGKLVLVGVSEPVYHQLEKIGLLEELGEENVYLATSILGDSAQEALQEANEWLDNRKDEVISHDEGDK